MSKLSLSKKINFCDKINKIDNDNFDHFDKSLQKVLLSFYVVQLTEIDGLQNIVVYRDPSPAPRPDPVEYNMLEYFNIEALHKMLAQVMGSTSVRLPCLFTGKIVRFDFGISKFKAVAPEGLVAVKTFQDVFNDIILLNYSTEILPDQWSNLNQSQVRR